MDEIQKSLDAIEKLDLRKYEGLTVPKERADIGQWIKDHICPIYTLLRPILNASTWIPKVGPVLKVFLELLDKLCKG